MSTPLKVIKPLEIAPAMMISTNVPDADYAEWSAGTTYGLGDRAVFESTVWESAQADNLNNSPAASPIYWLEVSPINRWKAFDTSNSTQTAQAGSIAYTLRPATPVTAFAALNLTGASSLRVEVTHATYGVLYDQTISLAALPASVGWWEFFFGDRQAPTQAILLDLPGMPNADITITLTGGDDLAVGVLLLGQIKQLGEGVRYGARLGIQDFSRKETNDFGDTILVQRAFARRAAFDLLLPAAQVDPTLRLLADLRATPCLWVASQLYEGTVVFGFYKEFDVLISYPLYSDCSLEIEGLT